MSIPVCGLRRTRPTFTAVASAKADFALHDIPAGLFYIHTLKNPGVIRRGFQFLLAAVY